MYNRGEVMKRTRLFLIRHGHVASSPLKEVALPKPEKRLPKFLGYFEQLLERNGSRVLAAHAQIPTLGWTVFVESPRSEAFAPLYTSLVRMALVLVAGALVALLATAGPSAGRQADGGIDRHAHIGEEHLVEVRPARHLPDGPDLDARAVHRQQEHRNAAGAHASGPVHRPLFQQNGAIAERGGLLP